jgi:plastocyanin
MDTCSRYLAAIVAAAGIFALAVAGCGGASTAVHDGGSERGPADSAAADAAADRAAADVLADVPSADAAADRAAVDAAADRAIEAAPPATDAAADRPAAAADAAPADATATVDVAPFATPLDGSADLAGAFLAINPCLADTSYVTAPTTVSFRVNDTPGYAPPCLKVPPGTTVTFTAISGTFADHPLEGRPGGTSPSPITTVTVGTSADVTFPSAGFFPYHCAIHSDKMFGVVWVAP